MMGGVLFLLGCGDRYIKIIECRNRQVHKVSRKVNHILSLGTLPLNCNFCFIRCIYNPIVKPHSYKRQNTAYQGI